MTISASSQNLILFCSCQASGIIPAAKKKIITKNLKQAGLTVHEVPELCQLATEKDSIFQQLATAKELTVIACYPRTVKWLFHIAGAELKAETVTFLNMREQSAEEILHAFGIKEIAEPCSCSPTPPAFNWIPWFPVIDYDRCSNCGQCLDFCLFGVYERDADGKVTVAQPQNCKTNCPACSRICPQVAIIFPKYTEAPVNGAGVSDEAQDQANLKLDMKKLMDSDIYSSLAARNKRAKSKLFKDKNLQQATSERSHYLAQDKQENSTCNCKRPTQAETKDDTCCQD